jgi:hypothetical protein
VVVEAVALRKRAEMVITVPDDGEDTGMTYNRRSDDFELDGVLDGVVVCRTSDVDRQALQKLEESGFDFSKPQLIEFTVEFRSWPPHRDAMRRIARDYSSVMFCTSDEDHYGFLEFHVYALVSYELVKNTQRYVTELMAPYHGVCASWAVMVEGSTLG